MNTERIEYRTLLTGLLLVVMSGTVVQSETVGKCYNDTDAGSVCFIAESIRDSRLRNWTAAMDYCQRLNGSATLPIVRSPLTQFHLTEFLVEKDFTLDSVWLGGRGFSSGWTWVDGSAFTGSLPVRSLPLSTTVAAITRQTDENGTLHGVLSDASLNSDSDGYICQYKDRTNCGGSQNNSSYTEGDSCFASFDESISWFLARNKCLMRGGDLATLTDTSDAAIKRILDGLKKDVSSKQYWIGLRKIWWKWASDNSEIKTVYFKDSLSIENQTNADQNCLVVDYKQQFAWGIRDCSVQFQTICQVGGWTESPSATTEATTTSTVSLPAWAVGLICGLAGLVYIVSLIVVGIICCKCCGNQTSKKNGDEEGGYRGQNSYVPEPKGAKHAPPSDPPKGAKHAPPSDPPKGAKHAPPSEPKGANHAPPSELLRVGTLLPPQPPAVPRATEVNEVNEVNEGVDDDIDYDYDADEFDDDLYEMPEDTKPRGVYANHVQVANPPHGRGRPR